MEKQEALSLRLYHAFSDVYEFGYGLMDSGNAAEDLAAIAKDAAVVIAQRYQLPHSFAEGLYHDIESAMSFWPKLAQHGFDPQAVSPLERVDMAKKFAVVFGKYWSDQPTHLMLMAALILEACKVPDEILLAEPALFTIVCDLIQQGYESEQPHD